MHHDSDIPEGAKEYFLRTSLPQMQKDFTLVQTSRADDGLENLSRGATLRLAHIPNAKLLSEMIEYRKTF